MPDVSGATFWRKIAVNPLFAVSAALYWALGEGRLFLMAFLAVTLHELAHAAVAEWFGLRVDRVEIWPFGGIAEISGLEGQDPYLEAMIALVGPLQNFAVAALATVLGPALAISSPWVDAFVNANLLIGLINLVPATPLDGGHMLRVFLAPHVGYRKAEAVAREAGLWLGRALLAGSLVAIGVGRPALNLFLFAGFLYWGAWRRSRQATYWILRDLALRRAAFARRPVWRLDDFAVRDTAPLGQVLAVMRPLRYHRVAVVDEELRRLGTLWEEELLEGLARHGPEVPIGRLLASR